jgi:hypothetical protein
MKQNYSSETNICSIGQYVPLIRHKPRFHHLLTDDGHWPCGEAKLFSVQPNTIVTSDLLSHLHLGLSKYFFPSDIPLKSAIIYPCCYGCYETRPPGHLLLDHPSDNLSGDQSLDFVITLTSCLLLKHSSHLSVFQHRHFLFYPYFERSSSMCFINGIN